MDTHIDVVADPKFAVKKPVKVTTVNKKTGKKTVITKDANEKFHVIVEVTPKVRQQMKARGIDWTTDALKTKLERHWVKFTGWLLFDREHALQAENTNPAIRLTGGRPVTRFTRSSELLLCHRPRIATVVFAALAKRSAQIRRSVQPPKQGRRPTRTGTGEPSET